MPTAPKLGPDHEASWGCPLLVVVYTLLCDCYVADVDGPESGSLLQQERHSRDPLTRLTPARLLLLHHHLLLPLRSLAQPDRAVCRAVQQDAEELIRVSDAGAGLSNLFAGLSDQRECRCGSAGQQCSQLVLSLGSPLPVLPTPPHRRSRPVLLGEDVHTVRTTSVARNSSAGGGVGLLPRTLPLATDVGCRPSPLFPQQVISTIISIRRSYTLILGKQIYKSEQN